MRLIILTAVLGLFATTGCLAGWSRGTSTSSYVDDDGVHPIHRTTVTQTASGTTLGASVPLLNGGAYPGVPYDMGVGTIIGGNGGPMSGNAMCVLQPDHCAVMLTATVVQPISITSIGGYGPAVGQTAMVGPGGSGTYAETTDDRKLGDLLAGHEKALAKLRGGAHLTANLVCQLILSNPKAIEDEGEREDLVRSCRNLLKKASKKRPAKVAKAGEEE